MKTSELTGQASEQGVELQTTDDQPTALVPYERGVSLGQIAKGTFGRFLPGSVIGMSIPALLLDFMGPGGPMSFLDVMLLQMYSAAPLIVGFGSGLLALGRWLYPDANVSGRKSFIAGLVSPIAILGANLISGGFQTSGEGMVVTFLTGVVLALIMYFAWLRPTAAEMRDGRYEPDQLDADSVSSREHS
jgi:hypothetical protein